MSNDPNPFQRTQTYQAEPPKKSRTWLWVLGILGGLGLLGLLICCGGLWFASSQISELAGTAIVEELKDNPTIVEKVGTIESASMNFQATMQDGQDNPGANRAIFDVVGSKSNARIAIRSDAGQGAASAELIMPDGQTFPLEMEQTGDFNVDMGQADSEVTDGEPVDQDALSTP